MANRRTLENETRCAIYTRKSTEEGLEQEFNSLDAQREAGEAKAGSVCRRCMTTAGSPEGTWNARP